MRLLLTTHIGFSRGKSLMVLSIRLELSNRCSVSFTLLLQAKSSLFLSSFLKNHCFFLIWHLEKNEFGAYWLLWGTFCRQSWLMGSSQGLRSMLLQMITWLSMCTTISRSRFSFLGNITNHIYTFYQHNAMKLSVWFPGNCMKVWTQIMGVLDLGYFPCLKPWPTVINFLSVTLLMMFIYSHLRVAKVKSLHPMF